MQNTLIWQNHEHDVLVAAGLDQLEGKLVIPKNAQGIILFALGCNSTRHSACNGLMARMLNRAGFATLLSDLLTPAEVANDQRSRHHLRFNVNLLAERLLTVVAWLARNPETCHLKIGCFGIDTGAGAVLVAATKYPEAIAAIACQSGRVDLAGTAAMQVRVPTLLIVGDADLPTLCINQDTLAVLPDEKRLELIPAVTHEFKEPGALATAIQLASQWFRHYLVSPN
jgi:dienelactone hydrolase